MKKLELTLEHLATIKAARDFVSDPELFSTFHRRSKLLLELNALGELVEQTIQEKPIVRTLELNETHLFESVDPEGEVNVLHLNSVAFENSRVADVVIYKSPSGKISTIKDRRWVKQ